VYCVRGRGSGEKFRVEDLDPLRVQKLGWVVKSL
jgi:hypothetical protein